MRRSIWPATGTARSTPRSHREPRSATKERTSRRTSSDVLMRGNPDGPLSSRVGCAEALLSFRYVDGINSGLYSPPRRLGVDKNKVMAGGTPANPAALVRALKRTRSPVQLE